MSRMAAALLLMAEMCIRKAPLGSSDLVRLRYRLGMDDRVHAVCDLLMGAAFADRELLDAERKVVEEHLASLMPDGELSQELRERIADFSMEGHSAEELAAKFSEESKEDKMALIEIIASVNASDDEYDLGEDEYLVAVAKTLGLDKEDIADYALDYEVETLKENMAKLRPAPPPSPKD